MNPFDPVEDILSTVKRRDNALHLDLWYPNLEGSIKYLVIGLMCVRAAEEIRVWYDYARDGWVVDKPLNRGPVYHDGPIVDEWQEVVFIKTESFPR